MKLLVSTLLLSSWLCSASIGDKAIDFTLQTVDDKKTHSLSEYKGKVILLNIWASWCKGCKKEMPSFNRLESQVGKGFKLITVSVDDSEMKAKAFLDKVKIQTKKPLGFLALYDATKSVAKAYACQAMPSSYLIDKKGVIQEVIVGSLNDNEIQQLVKKIKTLK